ncbi:MULTISPECIES: aspartate-semialdehyde dehydrogenase [Anaeromyxobacter]|uniref:aspartate-semialdehyde dehydrogenase n=1 Tax=Anaeromyxobacter TaxID=161492 RepID=UPI001F5A016F|nr:MULTISPECIES: aspartate-semialdehyde dehydrogenase [unclassified Anaeromyxobacter]
MPKLPMTLALVGATGEVGRAALDALDQLDLPVKALRPFASPRSAGELVEFQGDDLRVAPLADGAFRGCDVALFCAGAEVAREWAPRAWAEGCAVVDVSPAFRADGEVPLVVAELNAEAIAAFRARGVVATPGPTATAVALALAPLRAAGIERVVVSTYEPASGAGRAGVAELEREARDLLGLKEPDPAARFPHRLAFNLIPQVGAFGEGGATDEEEGIVRDARRVLGAPELRLTATAVRVPVFYGEAVAVNVTTREKLGVSEARELLRAAPGVKVVDTPGEGIYPMPMLAANEDAVLVGRLREDRSQARGLDLFLVVENTRKGAATNALQIARVLAEQHL